MTEQAVHQTGNLKSYRLGGHIRNLWRPGRGLRPLCDSQRPVRASHDLQDRAGAKDYPEGVVVLYPNLSLGTVRSAREI